MGRPYAVEPTPAMCTQLTGAAQALSGGWWLEWPAGLLARPRSHGLHTLNQLPASGLFSPALTPLPAPAPARLAWPAVCRRCSMTEDDDEEEEDLSNNKIVQFCRSLTTFSDTYDGDKFFTMQVGGC